MVLSSKTCAFTRQLQSASVRAMESRARATARCVTPRWKRASAVSQSNAGGANQIGNSKNEKQDIGSQEEVTPKMPMKAGPPSQQPHAEHGGAVVAKEASGEEGNH